jgi:putative adhesin
VTTRAGAVEGSGLSGETVVVQTQAGAMTLEFAEAPATLQATTEVGAVTIRVPGNTAYAVDVRSDVGSSTVSVREDAASPHKISVKTQVGAVTVEPAGA